MILSHNMNWLCAVMKWQKAEMKVRQFWRQWNDIMMRVKSCMALFYDLIERCFISPGLCLCEKRWDIYIGASMSYIIFASFYFHSDTCRFHLLVNFHLCIHLIEAKKTFNTACQLLNFPGNIHTIITVINAYRLKANLFSNTFFTIPLHISMYK